MSYPIDYHHGTKFVFSWYDQHSQMIVIMTQWYCLPVLGLSGLTAMCIKTAQVTVLHVYRAGNMDFIYMSLNTEITCFLSF